MRGTVPVGPAWAERQEAKVEPDVQTRDERTKTEIQARNEVLLVGRLAAAAEPRELPSGDGLTTWRLVVDRPPSRRRLPEGARPPTVDALECVAWAAGVQRSAAGWQAGDVIQVEGSLRRRFWRAPSGASSRYEVEVTRARRLARAG